jgi:hypothetical protein
MGNRHSFRRIILFVIFTLPAAPLNASLFAQPAAHVVISELYGGGGNSGSTYTHDFIELYNPTPSDVVMSDWSVQYQSGSGSGPFTAIAKYSGTIRSHRFFLIQANPGSGGTTPLPAPDAVAGITLAATSGKVALCSDTIGVSGPASPGVVDFAGYGTSNLFEGTGPSPAPGNAASVERKASAGSDAPSMAPGGAEEFSGNGRDSDENGNDFLRRPPEPQNDSAGPEAPGEALSLTTVYGDRWNLVSVPLDVADPSAATLFPGAISPLYAYRTGYAGESTAVWGSGYWVRFAAPETVSFFGTPPGPDTVDLVPGWNLVGSAPSPVAAAEVVQIPPGHVPSGFYGYDGNYSQADTLRPGHAYWVRSSTGGKIVLAPGAPGGQWNLFRAPGPELPPPPPAAAGDGSGTQGRETRPLPALEGAWPNPFNPATRIGYFLPSAGVVSVEIFDLTGRRVAVLANGPETAGSHSVWWYARRDDGTGVAAGAYIVRLRAGGSAVSRRVLYVR